MSFEKPELKSLLYKHAIAESHTNQSMPIANLLFDSLEYIQLLENYLNTIIDLSYKDDQKQLTETLMDAEWLLTHNNPTPY